MSILKLLHPKDHALIASISENNVEFAERGKYLESILLASGINIPQNHRSSYGGRSVIYFKHGDSLFAEAFKTIYYPNALRESGFILTRDA